MKEKLLLVGGGVITAHYRQGLANSKVFALSALADVNPDCAARALYDVPFYTDWQEALADSNAGVALLATPPAPRFELAKELLRRGVAVITEKPMCDSLEQLTALFALSDEYKTPVGCLLHWAYADETLFLKEHLHELGAVKRMKIRICDDYAASGVIRADRRPLSGAWRDSGINALSYLGELIDLSDARLLAAEGERDPASGQMKYARRIFAFGEVTADVEVDWRTESREKVSRIECGHGIAEIDHLRQTVRFNGEVVYANPVADRLASHYENAFSQFRFGKEEQERTLRLHTILFGGDNA